MEHKGGVQYGIPMRLESEYADKILKKGIPVVIVKRTDIVRVKIKERVVEMMSEYGNLQDG